MEEKFSSIKPVELKCEYKINPTGIDEKRPRFFWITKCESYNSFQTAFRILVSSSINNLISKSGDVWDSGKVKSSSSIQIKFTGNQLQSNKTYYWCVQVWNEIDEPSLWSEPAKFSTGLFEQNEWLAKRISHKYEETPEQSTSFQPNIDKWIWYPLKNSDDKYKSVYLQKSFELVKTNIIDSAKLIVTADEKFSLYLNEVLVTESDSKIFSWARPKIVDVKNLLKVGENILQVIGLNSYVEKPGFILRLEIIFQTGELISVLTDNNWRAAIESNKTNFVGAKVVAIAGEMPWRLPKVGLNFNPAAYFRKTFRLTKKITQAFVYCSAFGLYQLRINNNQVNESKFTPGWSNFNERVNYNSYDVTSILSSTEYNVINIILADGYYSGYCGWEKGRGYYGKFPSIKLQLMISYDDGSSEIIFTDESWSSSDGPIREADILMGEFYDSNFESQIKGWDSFHFNEIKFKNVRVIKDNDPKLISYKAEEVKIRQEFKLESITKLDNQKFIVDFGQNFAGFVRLVLRNVGKREIVLRFSEMLNDDGSLYTENIRMARAQDTYISRGDSIEIWEPLFTYHGFRYVEIKGVEIIDVDSIIGISINSLPEQTAYFTSSNSILNKLFECILWNQKSNYIDIPTDCPQRDERFGWTGDAVSFFKTAAFNFDVSAFYSKWIEDLFIAQRSNGALPPFAPILDLGVGPVFFNSAGWADAGIVSPFLFYEFYNDTELLEKFYVRMKLFINCLEAQSDNYILAGNGYGDWLCIGEETSKSLIASAYFAYDCILMKKIASILKRRNDLEYYDVLFKKIKQSFRKRFLNEQGILVPLTQTAAVLAIHFELLETEEKEKAISFLIKNIIENDYHLTTGFIGLSFIMPVLSAVGRNDIAWEVLTNSKFPSWFFMIENGATTLWERWDSYHPEKGFYDSTMNSFNHCSLGCIGEWLFTDIAGIKILESGYKKVMIDPFIPDGLTYAKSSFKTVHGIIKSEWKRTESNLLMCITMPFNTQAVIVLPTSFYTLEAKHKVLKKENDITIIEVGAGNYEINCNLKPELSL